MRCRVSAGTGRPGVSTLWLGEVESWICNFYLSVAARKLVWADPSLRYTSMLLGREATTNQQPTTNNQQPPTTNPCHVPAAVLWLSCGEMGEWRGCSPLALSVAWCIDRGHRHVPFSLSSVHTLSSVVVERIFVCRWLWLAAFTEGITTSALACLLLGCHYTVCCGWVTGFLCHWLWCGEVLGQGAPPRSL